jgi:hypothetical protein
MKQLPGLISPFGLIELLSAAIQYQSGRDGEIDFLERGAQRDIEVCYNIPSVFANDTKLISTAPGISSRLCNATWYIAILFAFQG